MSPHALGVTERNEKGHTALVLNDMCRSQRTVDAAAGFLQGHRARKMHQMKRMRSGSDNERCSKEPALY